MSRGSIDDWERALRIIRDVVAHALALGLFGVYLTLMIVHFGFAKTDKDSIEVAKEVATVLGPLVAVVFGFYFGERSGNSRGQAAEAQATATTTEVARLLQEKSRQIQPSADEAEIEKIEGEIRRISELIGRSSE